MKLHKSSKISRYQRFLKKILTKTINVTTNSKLRSWKFLIAISSNSLLCIVTIFLHSPAISQRVCYKLFHIKVFSYGDMFLFDTSSLSFITPKLVFIRLINRHRPPYRLLKDQFGECTLRAEESMHKKTFIIVEGFFLEGNFFRFTLQTPKKCLRLYVSSVDPLRVCHVKKKLWFGSKVKLQVEKPSKSVSNHFCLIFPQHILGVRNQVIPPRES